jgi:hypothetical protein
MLRTAKSIHKELLSLLLYKKELARANSFLYSLKQSRLRGWLLLWIKLLKARPFLFITFFVSLVDVPKDFIDFASLAGRILLTFAMAAIGLKVSFKSLIQSGKRGLVFGLLLFVVQILLIGLGIFFIN